MLLYEKCVFYILNAWYISRGIDFVSAHTEGKGIEIQQFKGKVLS